ncbi:MAG: 16S rRNA (adenine(1518)-N(6)/adenine(1519)-N(6))-dimethyltransferase RsmA [Polyangiales bacterium]
MTEAPEWEDPRRVLKRHGLAPKRGFSQNFLVSRSAVERIVDALAPAPDERVIELGPGLGTLTAALLRKGARVLALDTDRDMLRVLGEELGHLTQLEAREGDASALDLNALAPEGGRMAIAGNLPYAVTGAIFRRLVSQHERVDRAVLMVQREVRDRLLGAEGTKQYGALTVFTRAVFDVSPVCLVPAGAFHPPPKVDSAVVALRPRAAPIDVDDPFFSRAVRAAFEARRKTLRNALQRTFSTEHIDAAFAATGIVGTRRGETLYVDEFRALAAALAEAAR